MTEGFVVDQGDYGSIHVSTYQPGEPRKSFWTGLKQNKKEQIAITTLRCNRCGYLENFAKA
jgi:hypothetical protein